MLYMRLLLFCGVLSAPLSTTYLGPILGPPGAGPALLFTHRLPTAQLAGQPRSPLQAFRPYPYHLHVYDRRSRWPQTFHFQFTIYYETLVLLSCRMARQLCSLRNQRLLVGWLCRCCHHLVHAIVHSCPRAFTTYIAQGIITRTTTATRKSQRTFFYIYS